MDKLAQQIRYDIGNNYSSVSAAGSSTGKYFKLDKYRKALWVFKVVGSLAATATLIGQVYQATAQAGTGAKVVSGVVQTITSLTKVKKVNIAVSTMIATDVVVVNGLTYTCVASGAVAASREFNVGNSDTNTMLALEAILNNATYGAIGCTALAATTNCSITANNGYAVTVSSPDTTVTLTTIEAIAAIEVDASQLDLALGFYWVNLVLTAAVSTCPCDSVIILGNGRYSPIQVDA